MSNVYTSISNYYISSLTKRVNFIDLFRSIVIRKEIFNQIGLLRSILSSYLKRYNKGRDIIKLWDIGMISRYALPWHFVKHYLPNDCKEINRYIRYQAINKYAAHPNATVDTLQHLIEWSPDVYFVGDYLDKTAIHGKVDILKMIHQRYPNTFIHSNLSVEGAANNKNGHLSIIQLLHSIDNQGIPIFTTEVMDNAAKVGNLSLVQWLHQNRSEGSTERAINYASENGHFECVKFLVENTKEEGTEEAIDMAASNGHYDIVQYLHQHDYLCTTKAMDGSAENGHVNIIKYLTENRTEGCENALNLASKNGHFNCVTLFPQYLCQNIKQNEECIQDALVIASENGHRSVVEYLCDYQTGDGSDEFKLLKESHLSIIQTCTTKEMDNASLKGDLDLLKLLYSQGGVYSNEIAELAAINGHLNVLIWIDNTINDTKLFTQKVMDVGATSNINVVKWLHQNQTHQSFSRDSIEYACSSGLLDIVQYLIENTTTKSTTVGCIRNAIFEAGRQVI
ncbi:hypothetical protein DFA_07765 [Cavenderia fasciculata]|uniref:Ankyrin repeat-containing protein n=1 Tax=Cavenderia fasciculata TaxID=261658 RepID=F4Q365_CACFS|nr:uncharacterized protein DFA_07765 [Cavenderia fasciculata]EGG16787.1 hypothetical protein DFA_07765 [Cavenderia fasciculata]|eukprot:XP_004355261.1 hypothetical protein DFA_07765 [Cavenderia fasciculata]